MMMGHSVGLSDSYYRPSEKDLLEDYLKAVPLLTLGEAAEEKRKRLEAGEEFERERKRFLEKLEALEVRLKKLES